MTQEEKREYDRNWYHKHKDRIKESKKRNELKYVNKKRKIVIDYLKSHPCIDCKESDILVLDFDHINPSDKMGNIANMVSGGSIGDLISEIKKCDIRCANCHRRKTAKQFNSYKFESVL